MRAPTVPAGAVAPPNEATARQHAAPVLRGRRLALARVGWFLAAVAGVTYYATGLPTIYADYAALAGPDAPAPPAVLADGLARLGLTPGFYGIYATGLETAAALGFWLTGVLLFRRKSDEAMALIVATFLVVFPGLTYPPELQELMATQPLRATVGKILTIATISLFFALFLLFPDGRFTPRWTRFAALYWLAVNVGINLFPGTPLDAFSWPPLLDAASLLILLAIAVGAQVWRYRRVSGPVQRRQSKWFALGLTAALVAFVGYNILLKFGALEGAASESVRIVLGDLLSQAVWNLSFLCVPLALAVAILKHRLFDIDVILNRALVYGALTVGVVGLYVLTVGVASAILRMEGNLLISLLATALVAVLFQPLRERLQRGANRLLYGERDEPYAVVSRLGQRLGGALAPDAVLPTVARTVAEALKLPYVALALREGDGLAIVAAHGAPTVTPLRLPLAYRGELVGELRLAPRAPGEEFSPADRRLLADLARQAGVAAHAVRLTADLQRSRERLVTAREEERRRLRRDLHDGLGPALGAQMLKVGAARRLLATDPPAADATLAALEDDLDAALADIRRLVYNLRPPALDDLGLAGAIRQAAAQLDAADRLAIAVVVPEELPPLPAAVEVAAYRIAQEALTNVVRHARARVATVRLALDGAAALTLEVADDGTGLPPDARAGVGHASMRERAAELGGTCTIAPAPGGGTRVAARLPLPPSDGAADDPESEGA